MTQCYINELLFVTALLAIYGGQKAVRWWVDRHERNKKEVFRLVENIIELLSNHQQTGLGDNYLAINHVRDQLIPPQQRQSKCLMKFKIL